MGSPGRMDGVAAAPALAVGGVLAAGMGLYAAARRAKALHAHGVAGRGVLTGADWREDALPGMAPGEETPCTVRWSRAVTRAGAVDIEGLSLRSAAGDLLFASALKVPVGRSLPIPRPLARHGLLSTLLPVRHLGTGELVLFAVDPVPGPRGCLPTTYDVRAASPTGPWRSVASLQVEWSDRDADLHFDPVLRPYDGTVPPRWVQALRAPAYRLSRVGAREGLRGLLSGRTRSGSGLRRTPGPELT